MCSYIRAVFFLFLYAQDPVIMARCLNRNTKLKMIQEILKNNYTEEMQSGGFKKYFNEFFDILVDKGLVVVIDKRSHHQIVYKNLDLAHKYIVRENDLRTI